MRWSDDLGAKKGDLERGHQSELEGSGTIWRVNRALRASRAALRGMWDPVGREGREGSSTPSERVT